MTASRRRFSQEFKDEPRHEVTSTSKPIREVAEAYGVGPETLRNWLVKYRNPHDGTETQLTVTARVPPLEFGAFRMLPAWPQRCKRPSDS